MIPLVSSKYYPIKRTNFTSKQVKASSNMPGGSLISQMNLHNSLSAVAFGELLSKNTNDIVQKDLKTSMTSFAGRCYSDADELEWKRKFNLISEIRPAAELSPKDVIKEWDKQLNLITAEQIDKEIIATFDKSDQELALKALQYMCQFATMQSLNKLTEEIAKSEQPSNTLFVEEGSSLSSVINYLRKKDNFRYLPIESFNLKDIPVKFENNKGIILSGSVLLDKNLLDRLKSDPELLDKVKNGDHFKKIFYPNGWINGVNPFNQGSLAEIRERVGIVVDRTKQIKTDTGLGDYAAIAIALNEPIMNDIKKLGLENKFKMIGTKILVENPTAKNIEELISPNKMSEEELELIIKTQIPEKYQQAVLEVLVREAHIYTPRTLSIMAKQQYDKTLQLAHKKRIDKDNIYYLVPEDRKSFSFITMVYQITNDIPANRILTDTDNIPLKGKNMVVVLDDLAGTGQSLKEKFLKAVTRLNLKKDRLEYHVELVIAPMVSTEQASDLFYELADKNIYDADEVLTLNYFPFEKIRTLLNSHYYKFLKLDDQKLVERIIQYKGWNDNALSIVFPSRGPDNNNALFALIARKFTLNEKGVSHLERWKPLTEEMQ